MFNLIEIKKKKKRKKETTYYTIVLAVFVEGQAFRNHTGHR